MTVLSPDSLPTLAFFCSGATALAKKVGISGDWLVLVCAVAGAAYALLTTYQPSLLVQFVALGAAASGNVSLVKELAQKMGGPSGQ